MNSFIRFFKDISSSFFALLSTKLKQSTFDYCELQTADSSHVLVAHDGSLISLIELEGSRLLIGSEEFGQILEGVQQGLSATLSQPGHKIQVYFSYSKDDAGTVIQNMLAPSRQTAVRIGLSLDMLFKERVACLSQYCSLEKVYVVLWTQLKSLTGEQLKRAYKEKRRQSKQYTVSFQRSQNIMAAIPDLRESHRSFARSVCNDFNHLGLDATLLEVHDALRMIRESVDPEFTDRSWSPLLPGDQFVIQERKIPISDISDILWPALAKQLLPRDAQNLDFRTARVGDRIYATISISLFPKEVQSFSRLLTRTLYEKIPWRMSFLLESDGLTGTSIRKTLSSVLSFTSSQNRLINSALNWLHYIKLNTDDSVIKLYVTASTWSEEGDVRTLRARVALLAKALQGWGSCDVSEVAGDPYQGVVSTMLGISSKSVASASIAPLSDVLYMLPLFRPASPWKQGAVLFRSPEGKPWPYHPGSSQQMTWIDLFYARPGSGKSVLSNAINLAVCLSSGLNRLPRIAIIDIGPSSRGLIALLKDALPPQKKHWVAYYRLRMTPAYAINPFDTQLGSRYPTPQERSFLVNFLSLLVMPIGFEQAYDGASDMAGLIIDELYKYKADDATPNIFSLGIEPDIDSILEEVGFIQDEQTTWWEVTDALFIAGFIYESTLAQRHAVPTLSDVTMIARLPAVEDLYGKIIVPTGEPLIHAFTRMLSAAVREYPIISQATCFDLRDARVVALDLDEVAKRGGDAANRQTMVMYMLARYVLARDFFLTEDHLLDMPLTYQQYHKKRIAELREDVKRIVFDEFHRTFKAEAVRNQVIQDMREGRKWKVQVALLSQSIDDFDDIIVEFATSVFIMDSGSEQAVRKTVKTFGLNRSAEIALKTQVHGPGPEGATFLAQFVTKHGTYTQVLIATLGSIELWALNTHADDMNIRHQLYKRIGVTETRRILAKMFPSGSAVKFVEMRYLEYKEEGGAIDDEAQQSILKNIIDEIVIAAMRGEDRDSDLSPG